MEDKNEVQNRELVVEGEKKDDKDIDKGKANGQTRNKTEIDRPEHGIEKENREKKENNEKNVGEEKEKEKTKEKEKEKVKEKEQEKEEEEDKEEDEI